MNKKVFTVYEINRYIKSVLEEDILLNGVFIEGEISNYKKHSSGHLYFTLKDDNAAINCVMFKGSAFYMAFEPENGMKVTVFGRISLYERTGAYQLYAESMEPKGKGGLYLAFEQLKQKLSKEGLFDDSHKKPIPRYAKCIAVITSPTGAAIRDIIQITKRRNKYMELVIYPVLVQGVNAALDIAGALKAVNDWGRADVIILGRGGGSIEDLWPFNEEIVARAVYASKIPVISAVGHETDFTITDFVSDLRAPTPSAAAEMAVFDHAQTIAVLEYMGKRLYTAANRKLEQKKDKYKYLSGRRAIKYPLDDIHNRMIYVTDLYKKLSRESRHSLEKKRLMLGARVTTLENISPLQILKKGYAYVHDEEGRAVTLEAAFVGQRVDVRFHDGEARCEIMEIARDG